MMKLGVNFALERAHLLSFRFRQRIFSDPDDTKTEVAGDDPGIVLHGHAQALTCLQTLLACGMNALAQNFQPPLDALKEHLLLVFNVVVKGRLGDVQALCDIVERGAREAAFIEQARGREQHRILLDAAALTPVLL